MPTGPYTTDTPIQTVMDDPVFGDYGRLLFPADTGYWSGDTLGNLRLTWYSNINPEETVAIVNHLHTQAAAGETVFYDIYTPEEKAADPDKADTGLFCFRGDLGGKVAFCNAGGGFAYVGAMQDSFPHALELSRRGYNAFTLIYRPGAQTACEDLARAITFVSDHAQELQVYLEGYSGGGETGSLVLGLRPDLYTAYLAVSIQWDGDLAAVAQAEVPVYLAVGEADSYYGLEPLRTAYTQLQALYEEKGLSQEAIDALLVLDVRDQAYWPTSPSRDTRISTPAAGPSPRIRR